MRDQRPIQTARRKARQREREQSGLAVPACILCIEHHHTAGRQHDPELTSPLCEKHHRWLHEQLRRAGVSLNFEPEPKKRVAKALRSAAVYDRARADAMDRWASFLDGPEEDES